MSPSLPANCPVCGADDGGRLDARSPGYEWTLCRCAVVYRSASPHIADTPTALGDSTDAADFARYERRRRRRVAKSRRQVLDALEAAPPRGRLLDVGCSLGYALEAARSLGLEAAGVDVSPHALGRCRELGLDAREGTLTALPFDDASFSVALLKHVLEHTPRPRDALRELRRVLVPGAAALFAVPDLGYRGAVRNAAASRFFRGRAAAEHFVYYTPATLARLVEEEGFRVASVHPVILHRRAGLVRAVADAASAPFRAGARAARAALGLRKEFELVAVRR